MSLIKYPRFQEQMESLTLPNGLHVNLIDRPLFHQTYGILTTRFGSVHTEFIPVLGKTIHSYPSGIAHFLEHKLFEKRDYDAFDKFAVYGADSNAFTSFTRTSYLFSTAGNVNECVQTLLDFVFHPYFSDRTVNKEKGIIGQEIQMYQDDPNWQLLFGIIKNLYPETTLTNDIAGSLQSIQEISPKMLYECYGTCYRPDNMNFLLIGNFNVDDIKNILLNIKTETLTDKNSLIKLPHFSKLPSIIQFGQKTMNVQRPKLSLGIRSTMNFNSKERFEVKVMLQIVLEMLFGESSIDYQRLYDNGIIDDSFGYEIQLEDGFQFVDLYLDTNMVKKATEELRKIILNASQKISSQRSLFQIMKCEFIGRAIKGMNSNENIANHFDYWLYGNQTLFDVPSVIEQLTLDKIVEFTYKFFDQSEVTSFQIIPKRG